MIRVKPASVQYLLLAVPSCARDQLPFPGGAPESVESRIEEAEDCDDPAEALALIVNGFVKDVLQELPMEFAVEAQKLVAISLEGSVG